MDLEIKPIKPVKKDKKRKNENKVKPTEKQKKAFKLLVEKGCTKKEALEKANYSKAVQHNPTKVTESKGWQELLKTYLPDDELARVHKEGLNATTIVLRNNNKTGKIESRELPDYSVRHKYLDTAYKLKRKYAEDKLHDTIEEEMQKALAERRELKKKKKNAIEIPQGDYKNA